VPEPNDLPTPPKTPRPRRVKKFVLPDHHHDEREGERAAEHIEAFFEGPVSLPRRPRAGPDHPRRPVELDTRPDWTAALRQEASRHARYGHPASVLLIELDGNPYGAGLDRTARVVADVIRTHARETDRAVRVGAMSFRLLLPETSGRAARTVAERIDLAFHRNPDGRSGGVDLSIEVASVARHTDLEDALHEAERRMAVRAAEAQSRSAEA
jgi:diguanylate cyclase (GGDEF)-like protein